jgi:DivIVA domain-containing protein
VHYLEHTMAAEESDFPRVFRGYDPEEVDRTIARLRRELLASKTEFDRLTAEVAESSEKAARLELELQQTDTPTFAGFGHAFETILNRAEKEASAMTSRAAADAHNLKNATERERAQIISIAREQAERLTAMTESRAAEILQDALARSASTVEMSEKSAREIVELAELDAANARRSSTTEVTRELSTAKREAEKIRTEAHRELAEMKLILAKGASASGARLSKELLEVLRIDADAAAHRDEAEREYLDKHNEAVHSTSLYIEESQNELKALRSQANIAELAAREAAEKAQRELAALRAAVDKRALETLGAASQTAATITDAAERLAAEIRQRAEASAAQTLAHAAQQRDNFANIFAALGDLATAEAGPPSAKKVAAVKKVMTATKASATTVKAAPQKAAASKTTRATKPTASRTTK